LKELQIIEKNEPPTKVLLQAGLTQRSISNSNANQLQFPRDGTLVSICGKHQQ
jgi:hypothetical protein